MFFVQKKTNYSSKKKTMKKSLLNFGIIAILLTGLLTSCSTPIGITSWKDPQSNAQIGNVVVLALYDKLTYTQPIEQQLAAYFNSQNLKARTAMSFMDPTRQYTNIELNTKLDSVGADALILLSYKGTNVSINTTGGFYGGYRGWYGGGGQVWTTSTVNISAKLYIIKNDQMIWTADMQLTDPSDINASAQQIAQAIIKDWAAKNMLKNPLPQPKN
jgi:hypothetical protein